MSFWGTFETVLKDIETGVATAGPVIGTFVPSAGILLQEAGVAVAALEKVAESHDAATVSKVIQATATVSAIKQKSGATTPNPAIAN